jgi:nitric oxide synthase-interacting protein
MPQKHSKNNGSSTYGVFSYGERKRCSFMTSIDERTGADAQLPFGWCALSLRPAEDPVCTPSGHIYSRELLLEHMVAKGDELKLARQKWDADRAREAAARGKEVDADQDQLLLEFEQTNDATRTAPAPKKARIEHFQSNFAQPVATGSQALVVSDLSKTVDFEAKGKYKTELARTCFWLPSQQPSASPKIPPRPPRRPPSPVTGAELRSKDLVSLDLRSSSVNKTSQNKNDGQDVRYICHVSGDEITTQDVLLIKPTGCVILAPVAKKLNVLTERRCPVTGAAFRDKDVVKLVSGTSGYAGSGGAALQVKVHRAQGGGA